MSTTTHADRARLMPLSPRPHPERERVRGLPHPLTSLVGREGEIATLTALLRGGVRLLTLIGPGGVGKTRLAIEVAWQLTDDFAGGVTFVPLAPLRKPNLVASTLCRALGVRHDGKGSPPDRLMEHLRDREQLLVLDNFEHLVAATPLVTDLLQACPRLVVLVTSRARLRAAGERGVPVQPLSLPDRAAGNLLGQLPGTPDFPSPDRLREYAAIRLFVERSQAVLDDFALTEDNAAAVAEICHRLDGLPLAIELAAARSAVLSPPALLTRLTARLPLLTGGANDAPSRLRTMRDAIAWSHDLLTREEQALFRRLAVFAGGCTVAAAEAVGGGQDSRHSANRRLDPRPPTPVLDLLASLIDKSLLRRVGSPDGEPGAEPRFGMLETIREYGLEQLAANGEEVTARDRHAAYFLRLAEETEPKLHDPEQAAWLERLEREHANLRAALEWLSASGQVEQALRLAGALSHFWEVHGHVTEGRQWLEGLLARVSDGAGTAWTRAKALGGVGRFAYHQGDLAGATECQERSLAMYRAAGDQRGMAFALTNLGFLAHRMGDTRRAETYYEESLALCRASGDRRSVALVLDGLGAVATDHGKLEEATALLEESLTCSRAAADHWQMALTLFNLGVVANHRRDYRSARQYFDESLALSRRLGNNRLTAYALSHLGLIAQEEGDLERARALFTEGLPLCRDLGGQIPTPRFLEGLATAAAARGRTERAARLFGAADALRTAIGEFMYPADRAINDRSVAAVRRDAGETAFATAWAAGGMLAAEQAFAEAMALAADLAAATDVHTGTGCLGLTLRELEVLRLIAAGKSNREIGAALYLSPRTVERHITNVYRKIDAHGKADATAFAVRHGLA